jgi:DUF4097 and DUF4098 domain-containing protein YvlB
MLVPAAVSVVLLSACNLQFSTGVEAKETWTRSYKVSDGATVELREANGQIRVEGTSGNEVAISATKVVKGPTEEAAKAALPDVTIKEDASATQVTVESASSSAGLLNRLSRRVDYDVKMPRTGSLTIRTTNGEITVRAVEGFVKIETVNGEIELTGLDKGADVTAVNGRVQLELARVGENGIRCKTTNGQIVVTLPADAKATIAARVTNGVVHTENLSVQSSENSHRRLDATLGGGGPEIRLETTNGEVRIVGRSETRK